ncbi:conserved exported hypothetical protein [Bradyrhizobium oligotrophicum S58]|uniref:Secreted protein n=1 Tax=Bradyrhizobium oligotrophicum S58 TaxID=1245469 RepID=M4ZAM1_9BRAD|nr:hypothetical protein [Bradyrhizobium oligotrophicum]BAM90647.1 conserved exported hypothetical protein [Bradyrhizobium oligotrophicum S58]
MMMILRSAALVAAALTLANCCMSGTGCSGPLASATAPAASPAMAASPTVIQAQPTAAAADWDGRVASSEAEADMAMEPDIGSAPRKGSKRRGDSRVDVMSSQSGSGYRSGRMTYEEEQAADLADEARLKQKLTICRNCSANQ